MGRLRPVKREKLDPFWHKSRIAARIWLKAQRQPLTKRDKRIARELLSGPGVINRLVQQGIYSMDHRSLREALQPKSHALGTVN